MITIEPGPSDGGVVALPSVVRAFDVTLIGDVAAAPAPADFGAMTARPLATRQRLRVMAGWQTLPRRLGGAPAVVCVSGLRVFGLTVARRPTGSGATGLDRTGRSW